MMERYDHEKHFKMIEKMWAEWGEDAIPPSLLPKVGYVVPGVCAGFLYQTDSGVALLEGLISAKSADKKMRNECLDAVINELCHDARMRGFRVIHACSSIWPVTERAARHGFTVRTEKFFSMFRRLF